jgi:raffinose/stachyose/melibiose transport system permease protein
MSATSTFIPRPVGDRRGAVYYGSRGLFYVLLTTWTLLTLLPLVWMVFASFKTNMEFLTSGFALPKNWFPKNYLKAWDVAGLGQLFFNSVVYVTVSTLAIILFSMMSGYAFAKMRYHRTSKVIYTVIGLGILISMQAILIPLYLQLSQVGLLNSRWGLILVYVAIGIPMSCYMATEYIRGIPDAVIESAYIDGASNVRMFWSIVLPMTRPVMVVLVIINVLAYWNEFMMAFVLTNSPDLYPLPVGIFSFSSTTSVQYGLQFAALSIAVLPIILVYFLFHKQITNGVIAGAVKG